MHTTFEVVVGVERGWVNYNGRRTAHIFGCENGGENGRRGEARLRGGRRRLAWECASESRGTLALGMRETSGKGRNCEDRSKQEVPRGRAAGRRVVIPTDAQISGRALMRRSPSIFSANRSIFHLHTRCRAYYKNLAHTSRQFLLVT